MCILCIHANIMLCSFTCLRAHAHLGNHIAAYHLDNQSGHAHQINTIVEFGHRVVLLSAIGKWMAGFAKKKSFYCDGNETKATARPNAQRRLHHRGYFVINLPTHASPSQHITFHPQPFSFWLRIVVAEWRSGSVLGSKPRGPWIETTLC